MTHHIYALKSLKDGFLYIGMSANPASRLAQHNSGKVRSTKLRRPFVLIYQEPAENRVMAREREKYFKSGSGREFLQKFL